MTIAAMARATQLGREYQGVRRLLLFALADACDEWWECHDLDMAWVADYIGDEIDEVAHILTELLANGAVTQLSSEPWVVRLDCLIAMAPGVEL